MFAPGQNQLLANLSLLLFFKDLSIVRFYDFKKNFRRMCFTVQLSKIDFALPVVSNSFAIISCRFLPVKNFFHFFLTALWSLWDLSDAALIGYHRCLDLSILFLIFLIIYLFMFFTIFLTLDWLTSTSFRK